jgi:uncharacterized protein (TIGR03083 family)
MGFQQTFDQVPAVAAQFTAMLRDLSADEATKPVPGMEWTAAEVGAHVATMIRRYAGNPARAADRDALRAQNLSEAESFGADVHAAAQAIDDQIDFLGSIAGGLPLDAEFPFHLGLTVTTGQGWANLLSEFLVHGDDVSRATGRPWDFPPEAVEGLWRSLLPVLAGWLRPEARQLDEVYAFGMPFGAVRVWLRDGVLGVDDCDRAADHTIAVADPVEFSLAVPWRRRAVSDPHAALFLSRFYDI